MSPKEIRTILLDLKEKMRRGFTSTALEEASPCEHEWVATYFHQSNGSQHYRLQCCNCGEAGKIIKKAEAGPNPIQFNQKYADRRRDEGHEARLASVRGAQEHFRAEWFRHYNIYLQSSDWKHRRKLVLERDNYMCKACGAGSATQVHHLTYDHVCMEPLFDLVSVCKSCHLALHDREAAE